MGNAGVPNLLGVIKEVPDLLVVIIVVPILLGVINEDDGVKGLL